MATIDAKSKMIPFNISLEKTSKDRIIKSTNAPKDTNALWAEPTDIGDGKFILKEFKKGKWVPVDFLEGSGNSANNSMYAQSKFIGIQQGEQESDFTWLGIFDPSQECTELGTYLEISCYSKDDLLKKVMVSADDERPKQIIGVTEKGEVLFYPPENGGGVHLNNALRIPAIKNSFTGGYVPNTFVIDGESYELADVTKSPDYSSADISETLFLPLKKVWDGLIISTDEDPVIPATITIDGTPDIHLINRSLIPTMLGSLAEVTAVSPEAEQDIMNLVNDPNIYVPTYVHIINPHWAGGGDNKE